MSKKNCINKNKEKVFGSQYSEEKPLPDDTDNLELKNPHNTSPVFNFNWYTQIKNRIKDFRKINHLLNLTIEEQRGCLHTKFKFAITPYLLRIIDANNELCPVRRQFIPTIDEIKTSPEEVNQNICCFQGSTSSESTDSLIPSKLIHKHLDTLTIFVTDQCAAYCRFCSNKHFVGQHETSITHGEYGLIIKYLKEHPEISQVTLSGGDPLTLSDEKLEFYLSQLRKIEHISLIVIETRIPVVLPQRVTSKLCNVLKKYHPVYLNIMFNHPKEITLYTEYACRLLVDNGIPLFSTTVLLKGINDKVQVLADLFHYLLRLRVKPLYMFQCDIVEGNSHFRTSLSSGMKIIKQLRNTISWFAIPEFVININNSKIMLAPQSIISKTRNSVMLKDFEDKIFVYPEVK